MKGSNLLPQVSHTFASPYCQKIDVEFNEITWQWLAPVKFTDNQHRYVVQLMTYVIGTWATPNNSKKTLPFNKDEILIAWETPNGEKLWQIPGEQYKKLTTWLKARAIRLDEESREQIPALEYNVE